MPPRDEAFLEHVEHVPGDVPGAIHFLRGEETSREDLAVGGKPELRSGRRRPASPPLARRC